MVHFDTRSVSRWHRPSFVLHSAFFAVPYVYRCICMYVHTYVRMLFLKTFSTLGGRILKSFFSNLLCSCLSLLAYYEGGQERIVSRSTGCPARNNVSFISHKQVE